MSLSFLLSLSKCLFLFILFLSTCYCHKLKSNFRFSITTKNRKQVRKRALGNRIDFPVETCLMFYVIKNYSVDFSEENG